MEPRAIWNSYDIPDVSMCVRKHHNEVGIRYTKGDCACVWGGSVHTSMFNCHF